MKITKREYTTQMQTLVRSKAAVEQLIEYIIENEITAEYDKLNTKHDLVSTLERDIKTLESRWQTRNWTGSDWNTYDLIFHNID